VDKQFRRKGVHRGDNQPSVLHLGDLCFALRGFLCSRTAYMDPGLPDIAWRLTLTPVLCHILSRSRKYGTGCFVDAVAYMQKNHYLPTIRANL